MNSSMTPTIKSTFALTSPTVALFSDSTEPTGMFRTEVIQWAVVTEEEGKIKFDRIVGVIRENSGDVHGSWDLCLADDTENFIGYVDGKP